MKTLHNDHNVYILGAGFSADYGLPLVKDFMFHMRDAYDWLIQQNRRDEAEAIASVLQFRQDAASAAYRVKIDLENIEELFSLASASTDSPQHKNLSKAIRIAIAATLDYCSNKPHWRATYRLQGSKELAFLKAYQAGENSFRSSNEFEYHLPDYEYYLRAMLGFQGTSENTLISFNYDTVVEETLTEMHQGFSYGFASDTVNYKTQLLDLNGNSLKLLKLHGSINWGKPNCAKSDAEKLTIYDSYADAKMDDAIPDLIPPTWRKIFDGSLEPVWGNALEALKTATRIIVIGFSVPETDNHFKYLLAAGLQNNISLRDIVFVNPEAGDILQKKIDGLFTNPQYSRVRHQQQYAREYFSDWSERQSCNRPFIEGYSVSRY